MRVLLVLLVLRVCVCVCVCARALVSWARYAEIPEYPRKTWDEYLQWAVGAYDLVVDWSLVTSERQSLGIRSRLLYCPA